jgi:RNA polymerase sigma-70 factor (ECF subfamily)
MDPRSTKFDENRPHLHDVAYRMLGSAAEADDAVQEAWLRFDRADLAEVQNVSGWLTTVTARVCLDMLRARKSREALPAKLPAAATTPDPARDAMLADSVAHALLVVLDTLSPAERVAFVLHDMFDLSFEDIGRVLDRSEAATRQLASRARRRVQRRDTDPEAGRAARGVVDAFLAAAREGDFDALIAVLHPDVVVRADALAVRTAMANKKWSIEHPLDHETRGAHAVASLFKGRAGAAVPALVDGEAGAAWIVKGHVRSAFIFAIENGQVVDLELVMEPDALAELEIHQLRSPGT